MVYYYKSNVVDPPALIYMGKDKYENEELIKFHVDKLSSAHVYLRLRKGETWDAIPDSLLTDLAQLTKANSIEGNKKNDITIIYTPWSNLKKTPGMETGQVTFHKGKEVKRVHVAKRENAIINRLEKTREEKFPDLSAEKVQYEKQERQEKRQLDKIKKSIEEKEIAEKRRLAQLSNYDNVFQEQNMKSNRELVNASVWELDDEEQDGNIERKRVEAYEEDFM